jgi:hypothetical protein
MVVYPEHAALKWEDGSNSFYWEATVHRELSLDYYRNWLIKKYNAYEGVNKKGGYAFPLDKKELLGNVLFLVSTTIQTYFNNEFKSKAYKLYETSNYGNGVRIYGYNSNSVEAIQAGIEKRKNIFGIYDYWDNKIKANSLEVWNDKEAVKYLQDYQYFPDFSSSDFRTRMDNQRLLENIFERLHDYEAIAKLHEYFLINTQGENDKKYHQDKIIEARKKAMSPQ